MHNRLFIFDLDGTLLNTIGDLAVGCDYMLSLRGLKTHTYEEYCSFVGNGIMRLVERALPEELRTEDYIKAARKDFVDYYIDHIDAHTVPYDGMVDLVYTLQRRGAKLAVASNKFQHGTDRLIRKFFSDIDFLAVEGNREGAPLKPDPMIVENILRLAGVEKRRALMVGDSGIDVRTALAAGIDVIAVAWGFRFSDELYAAGAEVVVSTTDELAARLFG